MVIWLDIPLCYTKRTAPLIETLGYVNDTETFIESLYLYHIFLSPAGATLSWTQEFTASLHIILNHIKSHLHLDRIRILDIPCGDMAWMSKTYDMRHEKTDLKVFVVVIPKDGCAHPSFGMAPPFQNLTLLTS